MNAHDALVGRRTIHFYKTDEVDQAILDRALQAAIQAPNHKLTNPWRFTRIGPKGREAVTAHGVELKSKDRELSEAQRGRIVKKLSSPPVLFVVSQVLGEEDAFRRKEDYAACACAIQNMCVSLWSDGVGSKWSSGGLTRSERAYEIAQIDASKEQIIGFVWVGYPDLVPQPPRLGVEQVYREAP